MGWYRSEYVPEFQQGAGVDEYTGSWDGIGILGLYSYSTQRNTYTNSGNYNNALRNNSMASAYASIVIGSDVINANHALSNLQSFNGYVDFSKATNLQVVNFMMNYCRQFNRDIDFSKCTKLHEFSYFLQYANGFNSNVIFPKSYDLATMGSDNLYMNMQSMFMACANLNTEIHFPNIICSGTTPGNYGKVSFLGILNSCGNYRQKVSLNIKGAFTGITLSHLTSNVSTGIDINLDLYTNLYLPTVYLTQLVPAYQTYWNVNYHPNIQINTVNNIPAPVYCNYMFNNWKYLFNTNTNLVLPRNCCIVSANYMFYNVIFSGNITNIFLYSDLNVGSYNVNLYGMFPADYGYGGASNCEIHLYVESRDGELFNSIKTNCINGDARFNLGNMFIPSVQPKMQEVNENCFMFYESANNRRTFVHNYRLEQ